MAVEFHCISLIDTPQLRSVFSLEGGQRTSFIAYGPIVLLISIFNIAILVGIKAFREPPSDILVFTNIFSILKIAVIYSTMIYDDIYPPWQSLPSDFQSFCIGTGFFNILAQLAKGLYTFVFCIYYTRKVRNPLKAWTSHNKELHFVCFVVILLASFGLYLGGGIGLTPYGYCGIRFTSQVAFVSPSLDLAFSVVLIVASSIFLRYIRKIENSHRLSKSYIKYYFCFILTFCINQLILVICQFVVASTCSRQTAQPMFINAKIIGNCSAAILPLFIFIIIIRNQANRKVALVQIFRNIAEKCSKWKKERERKRLSKEIRATFCQELMSQRDTVAIELSNMPNFDGYLSQLKNKNRACLLSSILASLSIHHLQLQNFIDLNLRMRTSVVQQDKQLLFLWNYSETSSFKLTESVVKHYEHIFIDNLQRIEILFTSYAPNVLAEFLSFDGIKNVVNSLLPLHNAQQIINDSLSNSDGGRSGQFFYFTQDRTLILKTLSNDECAVYLERIKDFHLHFKNNNQSLIVKFYSVFKVQVLELEEDFNFLLMGNILKQIDKKYVLRTYDLKGSTMSRQVLKNQSTISENMTRTMKDVDFDKLQGKIHISSDDRLAVYDKICSDSTFLMTQGLIDYSLIVIKINLSGFFADNPSDFCSSVLQSMLYYKSTKEENVVYLLGIIDYLETWNLRKKGEKWYKSLWNKSEGISAQDPQFYSKRFIEYCKNILTP